MERVEGLDTRYDSLAAVQALVYSYMLKMIALESGYLALLWRKPESLLVVFLSIH